MDLNIAITLLLLGFYSQGVWTNHYQPQEAGKEKVEICVALFNYNSAGQQSRFLIAGNHIVINNNSQKNKFKSSELRTFICAIKGQTKHFQGINVLSRVYF